MTGHGAKSDRKQEQAILALLTHPTIPAAAAACGVADKTLWRWMQVPAFRDHYRLARRQVLEGAIGTLQQAATEAATALRGLLKAESEMVRLGACRAILEQAIKGADLLDLQERIAALEAHQEQQAGTALRRRGAG